jgi:hypothetical protein
MSDYDTFLQSKQLVLPDAGVQVDRSALNACLFDFQAASVQWALRKGRSALWHDTGLGKTRQEIEWSRIAAGETNGRALIVAPLAVAYQSVEEGEKIGVTLKYAKTQDEAASVGLTITNYERLHNFNPDYFGALCLDESGILKSFDGATRTELIAFGRQIQYRLAGTATPAPNDLIELANHSEFLGISTRGRMLSTFFINGQVNGQEKAGWRLKGHARKAFFRWLASWAMSMKRPSDLGFSDEGFILPSLTITPVVVKTDILPTDRLLWGGLKGIQDRSKVRRATLMDHVCNAADLIEAEPDEQWLIWCGMNDEAEQMQKELARRGLASDEVKGSDDPEQKAVRLMGFAHGAIRRLVTKPKIASHGMNFQSCARMVFVGIGDSFEQHYQCLRRCWRYGQTRPVNAYLVYTEIEGDIYNNLLRKEAQAEALSSELIAAVREFEREEIGMAGPVSDLFAPRERIAIPSWLGR